MVTLIHYCASGLHALTKTEPLHVKRPMGTLASLLLTVNVTGSTIFLVAGQRRPY